MSYFKKNGLSSLLLCAVFVVITSCKPSAPPTDLAKETIIPKPVSVTATGERFSLTDASNIYVENEALIPVGQYLADKLNPSTGFDIKVSVTAEPPSGNIYLTTSGADAALGDEGYELLITE